MSFAKIAAFGFSSALAACIATNGDERKPPTVDPPTADSLLKEQWHLFDPQSPHGEPGSINAVGAWKLVRPTEAITVALLDGGVNWTNPNLALNIWQNPGELRKDLIEEGNDDVLGGAVASAIRSLNGKDDDKNGH